MLRIVTGLCNPADAKVMAECAGCGGEIYEGEDVYVVENAILHADWDCLYQYINPEFMTVEEALGVKKE